MLFLENFAVALRSLRANKMRSLLTTLGIVIGTAAVIAVVSIVQGFQQLIVGELQGVGATYIMILPLQQRNDPGLVTKPVKLTWEDGQAILQRVPGIRAMTPVIAGSQPLRYLDRQHSAFTIGCLDNWSEVNNHAVDRGRFFSRFDIEHRRKVAVIGQKIVEELELGAEPIGKEIYVGSLRATVVGIMEKRGQTLGQDADDLVFVPYDTALSLFGRNAGEQIQIRLQTETVDDVERVQDGIKQVLRQRHKTPEGENEDFQVLVQDQIISTVTKILQYVTATVAGIVGIALLVGGIGIMNIMLVSVTERTREIGVRKSVGARRQDVLVQFLIEAITLSLLGGALGLAVGYGMGALTVALLPGNLPAPHVPWWAVALAFGSSSFVGILFGSYPAAKAARLDPIEALRYE